MSGSGINEPITSRTFPIDVLRRAATAVAENGSVGEVAAWIGVGRTTLRNFIINFTTPHPPTLRKIAIWYHAEGEAAAAEFEAGHRPVERANDVVEHACEGLLRAIPAEQRAAAVESMVDFVRALHREHRPAECAMETHTAVL
jgi:hypothetical protein